MKAIFLSWFLLMLNVKASLSKDARSGTTPTRSSISEILAKSLPTDVEFFKKEAGVEAKSGYITVRNGSHFFFLLMKSRVSTKETPLILWLQGGPGRSGLFGQFLENGPVGIDAEGNLFNRSSTFLNFSDVLYVDYPAGGGLSIIENASVLSTSLDNVTDDLLTFLKKVYEFFPEYLGRPLYLAGESYGARAAVSLAARMKTDCENRPHGVMLFAGFIIPIQESILKSQEFLYELSMLDEEGRRTLESAFKAIEGAAKSNTTVAALLIAGTVFNFKIGGKRSLFANLTGYDDQGSVLQTTQPAEVKQYVKYVNSSEFKEKLGIPKQLQPLVSLEQHRLIMQFKLGPGDYFANITAMFEDVLESEKVLIVNGQMDDVFPAVLFEEYFNKMTWEGSSEFKKSRRMPWKTQTARHGLAGYVKESGNLTTAVALGAGHYLGFDASEAVYDAVERFINDIKHSSGEQNNVQ